MSGRRLWEGYGVALGLLFLTAASCGGRPSAKPETPPEAAPSTEAEAAAPEPAPAEAEAAAPAPDVGEAALRLKGIKLVEDEGQTGVFLKLSRVPDKIEHFTLVKPNRLVIDLLGPVDPKVTMLERAAKDDPMVARVRAGKQQGKLRVTIDLKGDKTPKVVVNDLQTMVVAFLGERTAGQGQSRSQVLLGESTEAVASATTSAGEPATKDLAAVSEAPTSETRAPEGTSSAKQALSGRPTKVYTGQKISLDFKDADVLNVLRILAEVSGLNIVATDDVKGRVTVRLVDVPWDQALDIVLQTNRLDMVRIGNVVRVSTVTRLKEEREAQLAAEEAAKELEPLKTDYISVNYMKVSAEKQGDEGSIKDKLKDVMSERGRVQIDSRTNTVIVRDIQRGVDAARELIRRLDLQTPEVLIESNIVEANDQFQRDLGIQWGYSYGAAPQFGNATGREFPSSFVLGGNTGGALNGPGVGAGNVPGTGPASPITNQANSPATNSGPTIGAGGLPGVPIPFIADFPAKTVTQGEGTAFDIALGSIDGSKALNAKLTALEKDGKGKIISRPKIITLNNVLARIEAIRIFRVRLPSTGTVISTGTGGVAGSTTTATEKIETGIKLSVKPQVSSDGFVLLEINVKSSTADFGQQVDNIPAEISREAFTNVLIKDGETVVLGGVFRDDSQNQESGIPYLRSIPVIGWLFKNLFKKTQREELLVFITPRIVKGAGVNFSGLPTAQELWENRPEEPPAAKDSKRFNK